MVILVIAAHPDDEVLGCGGVMARHAHQHDEVHVLIVTRGIPELFKPEVVEETRRELQAAHRVLGVSSVQFLDFPAPKLDVVPGHEVADEISKVIQSLQPQVVYLPHRGDLHTDHQITYQATLVASRPLKGCSVRRLLCYETLSETEWSSPHGDQFFIPTVFVDITDFLDLKLSAMSCYRSQLKAEPHSRSLRGIEGLARVRGATVSLQAAEAFVLVREIDVHSSSDF